MKKYVKPDLLFEDFEMSVGVAACTGIVIGADGLPKDVTDPGFKSVIDETGLFGSPSCSLDYKSVDLEDFGYFGGSSTFFGS